MPDYRPDADELLKAAKSNIVMVRRIALAVGGAFLAFGLAKCFQSSAWTNAASAAMGAAIIGFFAPAWPDKKP
jgi:uncharacterized membrane-anchored protein YjiN (DUF445 family)